MSMLLKIWKKRALKFSFPHHIKPIMSALITTPVWIANTRSLELLIQKKSPVKKIAMLYVMTFWQISQLQMQQIQQQQALPAIFRNLPQYR